MKTRHRDNFIYDPSLVLYLPLYKRDGLTFSSDDKHGHLATVTGALWTLQGRRFDGIDDAISCGNNAALVNITRITLIAWVTKGTLTDAAMIISKYNPAVSGYALYVDNATNKPIFRHDGLGDSVMTFNSAIGTNATFLAATFNGSQVLGFINGVVDITKDLAGDLVAYNQTLRIGRYSEGAQYYWKGSIGEILIYNRALTPQEITRNYLATKWRYR